MTQKLTLNDQTTPPFTTLLPTDFCLNTSLYHFISSLFPNSLHPLPLSGFPAMMSTFPAHFAPDPIFDYECFPPWEFEPEPPVFFTPPSLCHEPVTSNSGSDNSNPAPVMSNSGSDNINTAPVTPDSGSEPKRKSSSSGSDDTNVLDERKRRRMISNRESARRSRMRKQKHLENLRNQATRVKLTNRELVNRFRFAMVQNQLIRTENEQLRSEAAMLRQRLWDIRQVLLVRQLQQHLNPVCMNMQ